MEDFTWKACSSCKKPIQYNQNYWVCNVSTCNRKRTGFVFCSVSCWDAHLPLMNHREAWAEERTAPNKSSWLAEQEKQSMQTNTETKTNVSKSSSRKIISAKPTSTDSSSVNLQESNSKEILVVASKVKSYINERSSLNTSANVMNALSDIIRQECDKAIRNAMRAERKTVMDRDLVK